MAITGISHVGLTVTDLAVSREWYSAVLGWAFITGGSTESTSFAYGQLPDGTVLVLRTHTVPAGDTFDERLPGLDHLSLACERTDLDEVVSRLDRCGTRYTPVQHTEYADVLAFRDPDNIALELTAPSA